MVLFAYVPRATPDHESRLVPVDDPSLRSIANGVCAAIAAERGDITAIDQAQELVHQNPSEWCAELLAAIQDLAGRPQPPSTH